MNVHYSQLKKNGKRRPKKPVWLQLYAQKWHVHIVPVHLVKPVDSLSIYFEMELSLENALHTVNITISVAL